MNSVSGLSSLYSGGTQFDGDKGDKSNGSRISVKKLTNEGFTSYCTQPPTDSTYSSNQPTNQSNTNVPVTTHNDVLHSFTTTPINTGDVDGLDKEIRANVPLFLKGGNTIKIPKKTKRAISRYVAKNLLREIHPDVEVAKELCLMFLSNLSDTYYRMNGIGYEPDSYEKQGWKNLSASILRKQFSDAPSTYRRIIDVLEIGTSKGAIIECDYWRVDGYKSYSYRLTDAYRCKGVVTYDLTSNYAKKLSYQNYYDRVAEAMKNPIAKNLMQMYRLITLPTREEIEAEATRLIRERYTSKKGKKLTRMGKKKKDYWKHPEQRSFVEESIEIFEYLTEHGLMVPSAGGGKSGGRVVDSFTLMPSWIRNLIKLNGEPIVEADYSALHPNIAMNIYGGSKEYLTHQKVAHESGVDVSKVKIEHLSFFNKRSDDMKSSPLFNYYEDSEPEMLQNIIDEKEYSNYRHKITSRRLFSKEVVIMADVIAHLNRQGIYVGYVYDALFCEPRHKEVVINVMNKVILRHGVKTAAK